MLMYYLVAIEHCNECYLVLLWFSHIAKINASRTNNANCLCSLYSCLDIVYARGAKLIWWYGPYLCTWALRGPDNFAHNDTIGSFIYSWCCDSRKLDILWQLQARLMSGTKDCAVATFNVELKRAFVN